MNSLSIREIKHSLDIVDTIGADVELHQRGNKWAAICPFHGDRNPSFFVFPDSQRFHCFGCGEHGDVIDFVQKYHGLSFKDSLAFLGIEQSQFRPETNEEIQRRKRRRELVDRFRRWGVKKADEVGLILRNCLRLLDKIQTVDDMDKYGNLYHMIPQLEYELEILISGNDELKFGYWEEEIRNVGL